jgi:pilus assembly protein FimV
MLRSIYLNNTGGKAVQSRAPRQHSIHSLAPRAIVSAVLLALSTLSVEAGAAGLGRLEVQSALGQPLQAELEITALGRDEAASLSARLASQEAFRQAGLEYNPILSGLRFAIESRGGRSFIKITSAQPINEPFVDLLVELNWASGKFVREYTFLLDPVDVRMGRAPAAAASVSAESGSAQPAAAGSPAAAGTASVSESPSRAVDVAPRSAGAATTPATRRRVRQPVPERAEAGGVVAGEVLVKRGDTLGQIARSNQPEGVSLDQVMVAIYQANPSAFAGNINRLRQGSKIAVPAKEAMLGTDAAEATKMVQLHSSDFSEYRQRLSGAPRMVEGPRSGQSAAGSVGAQVDDRSAAAGDQLRLSKPAAKGAGSSPAAVGGVGDRGASAEQQVASVAALNEARSRISDLEKNVQDLQNLLELKNKALADAQAKLDEVRQASKAVAGPVAGPEQLKPESLEPPKELIPPQAEGSSVSEAGAVADSAAEAKPESVIEPVEEVPTEEVAQPESEPVPEPEPVAAAEPGMLGGGFGKPLLLTGLGLVGVFGVGYGVYAVRRRRRVERFEDSLMAGDALGSNSLFGATGGQSVDTNDGVFSGDDAPATDMHTTEVDPIAEADVYIAYGRESQAVDILKEALKRQPERQAVRAKLLEIYSGRRDVQAFEALAREMYGMTGGRNEEWPRVVTQGLALDPTNPLYAGVSHVDRVASDRSAAGESSSAAAFAAATVAATQELRARVDSVEGVDTSSGMPSTGAGFDPLASGAVRSDGVEPLKRELPASLSERFDLPTLDFSTTEAAHELDQDGDDTGGLQLDFANLERLTQVGAVRAQEVASAAVAEPALAGGGDMAMAQSGRWQEMATKLDLAAAYHEIGDKEGARELLQEVISGGDNTQQQRARTMMREIV